jgi:hypothetical protein
MVVQARSIGQVTVHVPPPERLVPEPVTATAMFSLRADISTFTGREEKLHVLGRVSQFLAW